MRSVDTIAEDLDATETEFTWKKRALAVAVASALAGGPALAQDQTADGEDANSTRDAAFDEIVVKGVRRNMMDAQALKRDADTVIESITAADLGSFPDKSVAEALQRVAGITVNRFAATSDTAHFSAEPSGVIVRGLNQVRTEFNGRDSFSANSSRGLSWGDVSPELMAGVDTYKNQMASLIEGGIAGTVNMRTRLPFDQDANTLALSGSYNYGDISEEWTPEFSGLYGTRWELASGGEMGFLVNAAYSEVATQTEGLQLYRMNRVLGAGYPNAPDLVYFPAIVRALDNGYDRERTGISSALQFANADDTLQLALQYNRSEYTNAWEEYIVQTSPADLSFAQSVFFNIEGQTVAGANQDASIPLPAPGSGDFVFDNRGLFQSGVVTTGSGWWGASNADAAGFAQNASGQNFVNACYDWAGCSPNQRGIETGTGTRYNKLENVTEDLSFNIKYAPGDRWRSSFDIHYVESSVDNYDIEVGLRSFANADIDLSNGRPTMVLGEPTNVNLSPGGFSNPNNYFPLYIMDHVEDSDGEELALRADFEFDLDTSWLESVMVGTRYADRNQDVRWSQFNWTNIANTWTGGTQFNYFNIDRHEDNGSGFTGYPQGWYQSRDFDPGFYGGGVVTPNSFVFADMSLIQNQAGFADALSAQSLGLDNFGTGWHPVCSNSGRRALLGEIPGTCFTPAEIADVSEESTAFYVQLNFGNDASLFGVPVSGNVGVRYVETEVKSAGGVAIPLLPSDLFVGGQVTGNFADLDCSPNTPNPGAPAPVPFTLGCYLSESDFNFMNGASNTGETSTTHRNWLPSFNIKFEFTDEWMLRFAASRAMARPDMGNLRNYLGVSETLPSVDDANDPLWITDGSGTITGANVIYSGDAHNPTLAPVIADQVDLSLEYYFDEVGSFTLATFYKDFDDYIQFGSFFRNVENNGETKTVQVRGPLNGDGAEISGYEIAYQGFFDFLPAPFDGLGVQANYTHINNNGITNTTVVNDSPAGQDGNGSGNITSQAPDTVQVDKLEGLSDDSYTIIGMYEKGDWSARLAYSWRSEYLVTAVDCCVAYPVWNDDYGQLDASIRWSVSDNWEVMLSGSNLNNAETVLSQQVQNAADGGLLLPNAWFQNDRRVTLSFRYNSD